MPRRMSRAERVAMFVELSNGGVDDFLVAERLADFDAVRTIEIVNEWRGEHRVLLAPVELRTVQ